MFLTNEGPAVRKTPPRPKKTAGRFLKIFGFFLMLTLLILAVIYLPVFKVSSVEVVGNNKVDTETLILASGVKKGENIMKVNFRNITGNISKIPYIDLVEAKLMLPNIIKIVVKESSLGAYVDYNGMPAGIDIKGKVLEIGKDKQPGVARIEGAVVSYCVEGDLLALEDAAKLELITSCLKAVNEANIEEDITTINIEKSYDIKMMYKDTITVLIGNTDMISYKMSMLSQIIPNIDVKKKGKIDLYSMQGKAIYSEDDGKASKQEEENSND